MTENNDGNWENDEEAIYLIITQEAEKERENMNLVKLFSQLVSDEKKKSFFSGFSPGILRQMKKKSFLYFSLPCEFSLRAGGALSCQSPGNVTWSRGDPRPLASVHGGCGSKQTSKSSALRFRRCAAAAALSDKKNRVPLRSFLPQRKKSKWMRTERGGSQLK